MTSQVRDLATESPVPPSNWAVRRTTWGSVASRYAAGAALTGFGLVIAMLFEPVRGVPDAMIFAATIALTARFFGIGPSLLASGLSIVLIDLTMLPPLGKLEFTHP